MRCSLSYTFVLLAFSACTERNYYYSSTEGETGPPAPREDAGPSAMADANTVPPAPDASDPNGQKDDDASLPDGATRVRITVPTASVTQVTGTIALQIAAEGAPVERVDLWVDGALLASLLLPYRFDWDTSLLSEGSHEVTIRGMRGEKTVAETARSFTVDHTRPWLVKMIPESGTEQLSLDTPLVLVFSEPISAESIQDAISIEAGGRAQAFTATVQADPTRVELRLRKPAPTLPATATISLGLGVRDVAGMPLRSTPALSASFPSWSLLGTPVAAAGAIVDFKSDGNVLWALLRRFDDFAMVTTLRAAHWDPQAAEWSIEDLTSPPLDASDSFFGFPTSSSSLLTIDAAGAPVVSATVFSTGQPSHQFLKRKRPDGSWSDLPALPAAAIGPIARLAAEPDGSIVVAAGHEGNTDAIWRLQGGSWKRVAEPLVRVADLSVSEHGLTVVYSSCRVAREGTDGWVDLGVPQIAGGCTAASLFARPGSNIAAFVSYTVTANNSTTTTSSGVLEHAGGTRWRTPTFGLPTAAFSAVRSREDLLFVSTAAPAIYDARVEPLVRELPAEFAKFAVWEGAPVSGSPATSFFGPPSNRPLTFYVLNHIK